MHRRPDGPNRVSDEVLCWRFQHCVLRNMREAAKPTWEYDFPSGSDMTEAILNGHGPAHWMEAELAAHLGPCVGVE